MVQCLECWICIMLPGVHILSLASGQDLFLVNPDSTIPRLVNTQLVASSHLGFLINHVSVTKFKINNYF